jgi:uncharacterized protein YwgA
MSTAADNRKRAQDLRLEWQRIAREGDPRAMKDFADRGFAEKEISMMSKSELSNSDKVVERLQMASAALPAKNKLKGEASQWDEFTEDRSTRQKTNSWDPKPGLTPDQQARQESLGQLRSKFKAGMEARNPKPTVAASSVTPEDVTKGKRILDNALRGEPISEEDKLFVKAVNGKDFQETLGNWRKRYESTPDGQKMLASFNRMAEGRQQTHQANANLEAMGANRKEVLSDTVAGVVSANDATKAKQAQNLLGQAKTAENYKTQQTHILASDKAIEDQYGPYNPEKTKQVVADAEKISAAAKEGLAKQGEWDARTAFRRQFRAEDATKGDWATSINQLAQQEKLQDVERDIYGDNRANATALEVREENRKRNKRFWSASEALKGFKSAFSRATTR